MTVTLRMSDRAKYRPSRREGNTPNLLLGTVEA